MSGGQIPLCLTVQYAANSVPRASGEGQEWKRCIAKLVLYRVRQRGVWDVETGAKSPMMLVNVDQPRLRVAHIRPKLGGIDVMEIVLDKRGASSLDERFSKRLKCCQDPWRFI